MRVTTIVVFGLGYLAAEHDVFAKALGTVPEPYRLGALLFAGCLLLAMLVDQYVAGRMVMEGER